MWEWLARSVDRSALLLIGILRPVPQRADLLAVRRVVGSDGLLRLHGLSDQAVVDLVARICEGEPGDQLMGLASEAGGNPLYLTELMDTLVRAQGLTVTASGEVEVISGPVPDSLVAAITDRLDFLPADGFSCRRGTHRWSVEGRRREARVPASADPQCALRRHRSPTPAGMAR